MIRNYRRGDHETLEIDLEDVGSGQFFVKADGLEANAFYDMQIYSDSGRTTPLAVSDWEYYTEDERKTAEEAKTGGTSETVYNQIRILNPTYQTGFIYLTFESFGTYPNGDVQGIDYIEPGDNDYAYTTQIGKMTYIVFNGLTADRTVTVTDGGYDERSRFKIINKDSAYKVIVKDGTEGKDFWVRPGQSTEFYDIDSSIKWASAGWELVYDDPSNTSQNVSLSAGNIGGNVFIGEIYKIVSNIDTNIDVGYTGIIEIRTLTDYQYSSFNSTRHRISEAAGTFGSDGSSINPLKMYRWHDAA